MKSIKTQYINLKTRATIVLIVFWLYSFGQTNPTPQQLPYTQDFSALSYSSKTFPPGIQGWRLGTSSPGTTFRTSAPTANISLKSNSTAIDNKWSYIYNYNGKIGFLHENTGESAIATAISTTGKSNIEVIYNVMTIRNPYNSSTNTRIVESILQYRVGTSGSFTNLTSVAYRNNTTLQISGTNPQNLQTKTIVLPTVCNNQTVVQLRWVSRDVSGSGERPSIAIDNISIISNQPTPTITIAGNMTALSAIYGSASLTAPLTVSAVGLSNNLTVTTPTGFEVSTSQLNGFSSSLILNHTNGSIPSTILYVRLKSGIGVGNYNGIMTFTSGATTVSSATAVSVVNPKELNISGISISDKVYDGNTIAVVNGNPVLNGIVGADDVSISGLPSANFADANVGTNKSVIITGYTLSGTKAINYFLVPPSNLTASILPAVTSPFETVQKMGTGINLGNILSAPYEGNWAAPLTEDYVDNVARMRFKHVRVPIRFDNQTTPLSSVIYTDANGNYIGSPDNYTVNETYLNRIEQIVDWCLTRNLIVVIDVHGDQWFWESFDATSTNYKTGNDRLAAIDRFKAIWKAIALRFQNKPDEVLFEIMNEPFFSMNAAEVIDINSQMLSVIRQSNPTRNVIVTGGGANSYEAPMQLSSTFLNTDNHLIATYHYYRPFAFTSSASQQYTDNDWGTVTDKSTVDIHFNQLLSWSQNNAIPIYMGEFGADNVGGYNYFTNTYGQYGGPDANSRYEYHNYVAKAARDRGFALAVWDAGEKSGKTLYRNTTKSWVSDVRNAVLNSNCNNQQFINNADIECNYDFNWGATYTNGYSGTLNNSNVSEGYQNSISLKLDVNSSQGNVDGVVITNSDFTSNFIAGTNYNIAFVAKGTQNQEFQLRVKMVANGVTTYSNSPIFTLSNNYTNYSHMINIPVGTTLVSVQLLCGKNIGTYYFDAFEVQGVSRFSDLQKASDIVVYPNPASSILIVDGESQFTIESVLNVLGQKVLDSNLISNNTINIANLKNGIYYVVIKNSDSSLIQKKFIVKN